MQPILTVEDVAFGGDGVARWEGFVVFVKFVAPGERVRVEITEVKNSYARGELLEVLSPAADRVAPPCPYFGECGGCQYQHLAYATQLNLKYKQITGLIERIGRFDPSTVDPILPCSKPYGYRNRLMVRSQRDKVHRRMKVGFLQHNSRRVVDIEQCRIADPRLNQELQKVRENPPPKGGLKVTLRVRPEGWEIPWDSFFQNNEHILSQLVSIVRARLRNAGSRYLVDVYCGVGFFSVSVADQLESYVGVEVDKPAIRAARNNARRHGVSHGEFINGQAEQLLPSLVQRFPPDRTTVLLDPPRTGCDGSMLEVIRRARPNQVVYVSCHPATLARDLNALCQDGEYQLKRVSPLDIFPQTQHVECVADVRRTPETDPSRTTSD